MKNKIFDNPLQDAASKMNDNKTFDIYYCYGGQFKGANKQHKFITSDNEDNARKEFLNKWNCEEIYSITEITT